MHLLTVASIEVLVPDTDEELEHDDNDWILTSSPNRDRSPTSRPAHFLRCHNRRGGWDIQRYLVSLHPKTKTCIIC